jgi:two-component system chemotaxis sensor kinase CheA
MLAHIAASGNDGDDGDDDDRADLLARIDTLSRGGAPVAVPDPVAVPVPDPVPVPAPVPVPDPVPVAAPAPTPAADTSVRVDVALLDRLMNLVGELVLARNQGMAQLPTALVSTGLGQSLQRLSAITASLQEGIMKTRMLPIGNIFAKVPRLVRDVATACGKDVGVEMEGEDTELDRTLIEAIKDPITHLVRNAIDHGVEAPAVRAARGKRARATVWLRAFHAGGQVNIEIADDGNGIDCDKIRHKAVARGLLGEDAARRVGDRELLSLIFAPGFSTAEKVTAVSGRGVGMDVVRTNIERIGGVVDIETAMGKGTTVRVKIPLTLAIIPAVIVSTAGARYAVPQASLLELVRAPADRLELFHGAPVYRLRERLLPLVDLRAVFGDEPAVDRDTLSIAVLQCGEQSFGLVVDAIHDSAEIVVKPLGTHFRGIAAFSGATILGDGGVALILDVTGLAVAAGVGADAVASVSAAPPPAPASQEEESLLLCRGPDDRVVAIPLAAVRRLDKIAAASVERTGDEEVVQYQGAILPLRRLSSLLAGGDDAADPETLDMVVTGTFGLIVNEVVDIVRCPVHIERPSARPGVVGALVVKGRVTELLDVGALLHKDGPRLAAAVAA